MTPAEAHAIIARLWTARERALDAKQASALNAFETGNVRLTDRIAIYGATCGCNPYPYMYSLGARTFRKATVYVPRQTHYPLYFAANVLALVAQLPTPPQSLTTAMFVVTKASPSAPWLLAMEFWDSGYRAPGSFDKPVVDAEGYDRAPTPPPATHVWLRMLAAYYDQSKRTGQSPTDVFAGGPLTSGNGMDLRVDGSVAGGFKREYTFKVANGPWVLNTHGTTHPLGEVCGEIIETNVSTEVVANHPVIQPANREKFGWLLPPGRYDRITTRFSWPVCVYSNDIQLAVFGSLSGGQFIGITGHRAH